MTDTIFPRAKFELPWPAQLSGLPGELPYRESRERSPRKFLIGVILSLLFHAALLMFLPKPVQNHSEPANSGPQPLVVRLSQPEVAHTATAEPAAAPPESRPPPPRVNRPMLSVPKPAPINPVPLEVPQPPVRQSEAAPVLDFSAMLEARRAQRRASEEAIARVNAAAREGERELTADEASSASINRNLQTLNNGSGGTGGVFRILFKGHTHGQFAFNGWMPRASGGWREVIDVDAGPDGDVEIAMVRRMIELIRKYYQGDFNWESHRLGRVIKLSARKEDSAGLESFLMREFF